MNESSSYSYGLTKNFRACENNEQQNIEKCDKDKQMKIYILPMFCLHNNIRQNLHQQKIYLSPKSSPTINLSIKSLQTTHYKIFKKNSFHQL